MMTATMTVYNFAEIVFINFPYTDEAGSKLRPAVVISSALFHEERQDVILTAITKAGQRRSGDVVITKWAEARLTKPSTIKPVLFTVKAARVVRKLGALEKPNIQALRSSFDVIFG